VSYEVLMNSIRKCLETYPDKKVSGISRRRHGSAAGIPFEEWARDAFRQCNFNVFLQEEFIEYIIGELKRIGFSREKIRSIIKERTWWGIGDYVISKSQLDAALNSKKVPVYQQSIADVVIFYGEIGARDLGSLNNVLLVNVKSHDMSKLSRPPNIISALRVLEFARDLLRRSLQHPDFIEKANLIFIGIYYQSVNNYAQIMKIYIRDFFKLDVTRMPPINFDAANQIQWHIKDMVENPSVDKLTFFKSIAKKYLDEWQKFMSLRTSDVRNLVGELERLIERFRQNK